MLETSMTYFPGKHPAGHAKRPGNPKEPGALARLTAIMNRVKHPHDPDNPDHASA